MRITYFFNIFLLTTIFGCETVKNKAIEPKFESDFIKINLDKTGYGKSDEFFKNKAVMPLFFNQNDSTYYAKIPFRFHQERFCEDTIYLELTKSKRFDQDFFESIACMNCAKDNLNFFYDSSKGTITVSNDFFRHIYFLYKLSDWRNKGYSFINDPIRGEDLVNITNTNEWLVIHLEYLKYGSFKLGDSTYYIGVFDGNRNGKYESEDYNDYITISPTKPYFYTFNSARSKKIQSVKNIKIFGNYFRIIELNMDGEFVVLKKEQSISQENTVYIDSIIKNNFFISNNEEVELHGFLHKGKHLLVDLSNSVHDNPDEITALSEFQKKHHERLTVLGLYKDDITTLNKAISFLDIAYLVGISNEKITEDLLQIGYPYRVLISPSGKIIKHMRNINYKELEGFISQ